MTAMTTATMTPPPTAERRSPRRKKTSLTRQNAADWHESLGCVPLERVLMDPPPGTVTFKWYERTDARVDGRLVELINNTLVEKRMGRRESMVAMEVGRLLGNHIKANKLGGRLSGEAGTIRMRGKNVRMPDVCWTSPDGINPAEAGRPMPMDVPTLAVEVLSDSNTAAEIRLKLIEFFASGCRLAWVLYPRTSTVRVHADPKNVDHFVQFVGDDTLDGGDVLPGFSVKVAELFDV